MSYAGAVETYRKNAVLTASPEKLVQLLYEGAIRHLDRSLVALRDPAMTHSAGVGEALGKALGIVSELRSSLDESAGDVAVSLDQLYEFSIEQISQANLRREPEPVEAALRVLRTLKEGWDGIIAN